MLRRWLVVLMALSLLPTVVLAEDDDDDAGNAPSDRTEQKQSDKSKGGKPEDKSKDDDKKAKSKDGDDAKTEAERSKANPIKKLIELKLDPFVVPSRGLNIPSFGRVREVRDILERFERWAKDEEVGALLLNLDGLALSIPDIEEIRAALLEFKKDGKKVLAYLNNGEPNGYLLACVADEIALAPTGDLAIPGLGRVFPYMRGFYQMRGIEYDVITAGRFKYPGFMNAREPNDAFKMEFEEILDSWFGDYVQMIADGRKLDPQKVRNSIDVALMTAEEAKSRGLVDHIAYYDEYRDRVLRRLKFRKSDGETDFSNITSLQDIANVINKRFREAQESYKAVGPKIAILHARGPIVDFDLGGSLSSQLIMREPFVRTIEEIRKNKTIKAVVLRIDSPGGSGYASDVIWRKLRELDEEKPIIVSMGSVAGSGGYYIACPGRLIFAEPTTITGSIGVLAILANQASMLNRMDVNIATMQRGKRALFGAGVRDMHPDDRAFLQKFILDFYEVFLDRVSVARRMPKDEVRKVAEGRIYTGRQALKIGLVDRLGGLKDAIAAAREMASIPASSEIRLVHYPRPSGLGELFGDLLGGVSTPAQAMTVFNTPIPSLSFDMQLRIFAHRPQPLCWLPLPDARELMLPMGPRETLAEMLGLPPVTPALLPMLQP